MKARTIPNIQRQDRVGYSKACDIQAKEVIAENEALESRVNKLIFTNHQLKRYQQDFEFLHGKNLMELAAEMDKRNSPVLKKYLEDQSLRTALEKYGEHSIDCKSRYITTREGQSPIIPACSCGLKQTLNPTEIEEK